MRKIHFVLAASALLFIQPALADDMSESKPCGTIAKACIDAGYTREDNNQKFWQDCMKPVLMGETVKNVTIDAATVKECRVDKIEKMKKELKELQAKANH